MEIPELETIMSGEKKKIPDRLCMFMKAEENTQQSCVEKSIKKIQQNRN